MVFCSGDTPTESETQASLKHTRRWSRHAGADARRGKAAPRFLARYARSAQLGVERLGGIDG